MPGKINTRTAIRRAVKRGQKVTLMRGWRRGVEAGVASRSPGSNSNEAVLRSDPARGAAAGDASNHKGVK